MGSSPKTKSDYRAKIARLEADIERLKFTLSYKTSAADKSYIKGQIADKKRDIANLKADMAKAPRG